MVGKIVGAQSVQLNLLLLSGIYEFSYILDVINFLTKIFINKVKLGLRTTGGKSWV